MLRIFKTAGVLTVIGVLVGLCFSINSSTSVTGTSSSNAVPQTTSEPKSEVQTPPTAKDPFKKFLDEKAGSSNTVTNSDNAQGAPLQPGKDPFKEFLDKQKQNSKDQVVSPFGKN